MSGRRLQAAARARRRTAQPCGLPDQRPTQRPSEALVSLSAVSKPLRQAAWQASRRSRHCGATGAFAHPESCEQLLAGPATPAGGAAP